jgi:hypothetical protein
MFEHTYFVIFKSDSRFSITEFCRSGIKQAFMSSGTVSGDNDVLSKLSQMKPEDVDIESYLEKNAGHIIYAE